MQRLAPLRVEILVSSMSDRAAIICPLSVEAVPELYEIELECNRPVWSPQLIANEFRHAHSRVWGARARGRVVGFIVVHVVLDEAHILNFGVRLAFRGMGVGRELIQESLTRLSDEGVRTVSLEVRESNAVARTLYAELGFVEAGIRPRYYTDNGEDALTLRLDMQNFLAPRRLAAGS